MHVLTQRYNNNNYSSFGFTILNYSQKNAMSQSEFAAISIKDSHMCKVHLVRLLAFHWLKKVGRVLLANHREKQCKTIANAIYFQCVIENCSITVMINYSVFITVY